MKATMRKSHGKSGYRTTGALKGSKSTKYAGAMKKGGKSKGSSKGY